MSFEMPRLVKFNYDYTINNGILENVDEFMDLGITVSKDMNFKGQDLRL